MAAILCKPITSCFEFICTAPCKLCGAGCKLCSDGLTGLCTNPLSAFVMVTFLTQIPLAVASTLNIAGGLFSNTGGCNSKASQWMVGMLIVAIAHMFTSVYLAVRVTNSTDEALRNKHTSWERISYLLCHDPWIAIYLLIVLFYIIWLVIGSSWNISGKLYSSDCNSDDDDNNNVAIVLGLGWTYLFLGPAVLSCNLCCVCCDKKDYAGDEEAFAAKEDEKRNKKKKNNRTSTTHQANNNNNKNYNEYTTTSADIENNSNNRTYSADGMPIPDETTNNTTPVVEAQVVIEGDTLPPPMKPPQKKDNAFETTTTTTTATQEAAAKVQEKAGKAAKSVGAWFNNKNKKKAVPEREATLY